MILGYILMTSSGIPLWFKFFQNISVDRREKYELFSSAIAAVLSLINETFSDDIKEIIMDNHRLFLMKSRDIILLIVGDKYTKAPTDEFRKFVDDVSRKINPDLAIEEIFLRSIIDSLAEFELKIEELNAFEKISKNI